VDRAVLYGAEGFVKIHVKEGADLILGATIVISDAGDMINEITLQWLADLDQKPFQLPSTLILPRLKRSNRPRPLIIALD
jgi:pyruvate/2-oxoglutarate dehydrogenase complex dihydrolipoamide dehydrogenase (E3) component